MLQYKAPQVPARYSAVLHGIVQPRTTPYCTALIVMITSLSTLDAARPEYFAFLIELIAWVCSGRPWTMGSSGSIHMHFRAICCTYTHQQLKFCRTGVWTYTLVINVRDLHAAEAFEKCSFCSIEIRVRYTTYGG